MATDGLSVLDMWTWPKPERPPRSRLYALEPVGDGTPWVESLTGYVARLAESHCVSVRTLVFHELAPRLGRTRWTRTTNSGLSAFWAREAQALNGTRILAQDWVRILERQTGRNDLRGLTLLPWADVLSSRGLLRARRAWCPECYTAWQAEGRTVYEPLLWALQVVTICSQHRRRLCVQCPACRQTLPLLNSKTRPGYCSKCGGWLGATEGTKGAPLSEAELTWHTWNMARVGELITYGSIMEKTPRREQVAEVISACIRHGIGGSMKGVAQELRLSSGAVWGWLNNAQVPQLENLLRICYLLDISLLRLLTDESVVDDIPKLKPRPLPSFLKRSRKRSPRPFDAQAVQHTLEAVLERGEDPPPPMRTVAKRLDYSHSFLHKRFPDLCRAISARYMTHQKKRGRQREQKLCEEIAQAVERLHAQDLYPSAYRIEPLLSEPGFMRHPTALAIWHQKLQELGWESKPGK